MFAGRKKSCDNKSADKYLVDKGNESDDSDNDYAGMPSLVCHSGSGISYSSADSDYQTESDVNDSKDNKESFFSSSYDDDDYGYENDGYKSEDSYVDMPDLISPNQQVTNAMKKLDTSSNPIAQNIVAESLESARMVPLNENTEGTITSTIDTYGRECHPGCVKLLD